MANYGYGGGGGGYSTTTYGAQGGADGGGFVAGYGGGSQAGSQGTPSGTKPYGKDTLRPVTIKQILDASQPHPDAEFKIDGSEVSQLSFIGQIHSVSIQATNTTFKIDDGTGLIDVKDWTDKDADPEDPSNPSNKPLPVEGHYIHVWGRLKEFNDKRHIACHVYRPIVDFNEISMHLLEATAVHLYFTRGPLESGGNANGNGNIKTEDGGMFVDGGYGAGTTNGAAAAGGAGGGKALPAKASALARKVYIMMQSVPQNNEGLHVHQIAAQLKIPVNDVFKAGDELLGDGLIYTTVDDETWAVLEY